MTYLRSLGRRVFGPRKPEKPNKDWRSDGVTKEEILRIFARELQRYSNVKG